MSNLKRKKVLPQRPLDVSQLMGLTRRKNSVAFHSLFLEDGWIWEHGDGDLTITSVTKDVSITSAKDDFCITYQCDRPSCFCRSVGIRREHNIFVKSNGLCSFHNMPTFIHAQERDSYDPFKNE